MGDACLTVTFIKRSNVGICMAADNWSCRVGTLRDDEVQAVVEGEGVDALLELALEGIDACCVGERL